MSARHAYPPELARFVLERQAKLGRKAQLPDEEALTTLLSVAYQASLVRDEDRQVRFRLIVGSPDALPSEDGPPEGLHVLRFVAPRVYNEDEVRRLSQAAKYHRALIGVRVTSSGEYEIWGIVQSGPRWLQSARGGRDAPSPVPEDAVVVRVSGPGRMSLMVGEVMLGEIRGGRLSSNALNVFGAEWLSRKFAGSRAEIVQLHREAVGAGDPIPLDPEVTRIISQQMVKRLIATMQDAHHGGACIFVPREREASILDGERLIRLKYAFEEGEPRRRYRTLILRVMRELVAAGRASPVPLEKVGWDVYQSSSRPEIAAVDEAVLEMSQLLAALGDVDGAVVLNERFEILGFGAELVSLPEVTTIRRARDLEATQYDVIPTDNVGTRHRSAYRLCAREHGALAVVVSQDGGVQFITWHEGALTYWEHRNEPGG